MTTIIKGKPVADAITRDVINDVNQLKSQGINPKLKIIRVGERGDDIAYENGAVKRMDSCGILVEKVLLSEDICLEDFIKELKKANEDNTVHGILIFRPLPKQLDESIIKNIISPEKDIDCFNPANMAKIMEGDKTGFPPCTPWAVIEILHHYNVELKGKKAIVLGRSLVVGKPLSMLLLGENATVTICHSKTENLNTVASEADVLVAAIGRAKMVDSSYVKKDAVVIDVGINVDKDGKLCGDVDTEDCLDKVSMITPVPAGVGSVTTSVLAKHVIKACNLQNRI